MAEDTVYALDSGGNRIATFSAEQILEAINAAITTGEIPSELTAFIDAIKEQNKGKSLKFWMGTQAEFLALDNTEEDIIYFINDSTNLLDLANALEQLKEQLQSGDFVVKKAEKADDATNVTMNINGKAISSIFENNGTTVKEATNAKSLNGKVIYKHFGRLTAKSNSEDTTSNIRFTFISKRAPLSGKTENNTSMTDFNFVLDQLEYIPVIINNNLIRFNDGDNEKSMLATSGYLVQGLNGINVTFDGIDAEYTNVSNTYIIKQEIFFDVELEVTGVVFDSIQLL